VGPAGVAVSTETAAGSQIDLEQTSGAGDTTPQAEFRAAEAAAAEQATDALSDAAPGTLAAEAEAERQAAQNVPGSAEQQPLKFFTT
jgi:hypothetical protein